MLDLAFKVLQIIALLGGGALLLFKLGRTTERVEQTLERQNVILQQNADEIVALKEETKKVNLVLTEIALQKQQLEMLDRRYEELRHGEGFVFPIAQRLAERGL